MINESELTPSQRKAIRIAREHDGTLYRHRGGYWSGPDHHIGGEYVTTHTVRALQGRGILFWSRYETDRRNGRWPSQASLYTVIREGWDDATAET